MVDGGTHARGVRHHETAAHISVVQQLEACFKFVFGFGNFQNQALVGVGIALNK